LVDKNILIERQKRQELAKLLERKLYIRENVPFLPDAGHKLYEWQHYYIQSKNKVNLLTAANQTGKSSCNIIKCLRWAYTPELWPKLWKRRPTLFWYFYPTLDNATLEFQTKWLPTYMPKECMKNDDKYGYRLEYDKDKKIKYIMTATGIMILFRSYEIQPKNIQAATVFAVFGDEECPISHYPEINARLMSTDGYYHNVFTATLGQEYLRCAMEERGTSLETFTGAFKRQISLYECLTYMDGSPSTVWTIERIEAEIKKCSSKEEVDRRILGKFVKTTGLRYSSFSYERNVKESHPIPKDWLIYAGIDYGSGGAKNHPSAIVFVGVSPDYEKARVFRCWRGDGIKTTQGDVIQKYIELSQGMEILEVYYDYSAADMDVLAARHGISFTKANKDREWGIPLVNTLFSNGQLVIYSGDENDKLIAECQTVADKQNKKSDGDDLSDALRYGLASIPFKLVNLNTYTNKEVSTDQVKEEPMNDRLAYYYGNVSPTMCDEITNELSEAMEMFNE
jgi:hypothetical protein